MIRDEWHKQGEGEETALLMHPPPHHCRKALPGADGADGLGGIRRHPCVHGARYTAPSEEQSTGAKLLRGE
jgi:hypothetical protein